MIINIIKLIQLKKTISISMIFSIILLPSCSLFGPRMQTIRIDSIPEGSDVYVNDDYAGQTPLAYQVHRGEDVLIKVQRDGYRTHYRTTSRSLSTLGILDIIGGSLILVPFFGLFSSAAWKHEPAIYMFSLKVLDEDK